MDKPQELIDLGTELAKLLPNYVLRQDEYQWAFTLNHVSGDGRGIFVSVQDRLKYDASLQWPHSSKINERFRPDRDEGFVSSVRSTKTRGIEGLAKEIIKRILPNYNEEYAKQQKRMQEAEARKDNWKAVRKHLVEEVLGDTIATHQEESQKVTVYRYGVGSVQVSHDATQVSLELNYLPMTVALKVLELLKKEMPKSRNG